MKPAPFHYHEPKTLVEALDLLAQFGETAKPLAGGQSLVPMMNFRLARPAHLVDLNGVRELNYLKVENGELRIGAMTRQRALERSPIVAESWPLLQEATRHIGHVQIRNRGTVGGSLAHAYPSAELPVAMTALEASFVLRREGKERLVAAKEFFVDVMTTLLQPGELLIEIRVPQPAPRTGSAFEEVSRRHGDFALAGAAATVTLRADGTMDKINLVFAGVAPVLWGKAATLIGQRPDSVGFQHAAAAAAAELDCESDIHASAEYRREASKALARRALEKAAGRAASWGVKSK
jgi:aerobic carbon-monoxide dehydrogenase medium subunit